MADVLQFREMYELISREPNRIAFKINKFPYCDNYFMVHQTSIREAFDYLFDVNVLTYGSKVAIGEIDYVKTYISLGNGKDYLIFLTITPIDGEPNSVLIKMHDIKDPNAIMGVFNQYRVFLSSFHVCEKASCEMKYNEKETLIINLTGYSGDPELFYSLVCDGIKNETGWMQVPERNNMATVGRHRKGCTFIVPLLNIVSHSLSVKMEYEGSDGRLCNIKIVVTMD